MTMKIFQVIVVTGLLSALGAAVPDGAAYARGCLSSGDARAAVRDGRALPLSSMLSQIRATAGGEILPPPKLCDNGGRLVYVLNVLTRGGNVKRLTVDATSGRILGK